MKLNPAQQRAVESAAQNTLVLAGPGSGKTHVLVERIRFLLDSGALPETICAVTFTNAAAREIRQRLPDIALGHCGTLHALMFKLLQRDSDRQLSVLDEAQAKDVLQQAIKALKYKGTLKEIKKALEEGPLEYDVCLKTSWSKAETVAARYFKDLARDGLLDFDSILHLAYQTIIKDTFTCEFRHLLVDEFQDCSDFDSAIYNVLGRTMTRFVVADPDQAIFSFRGGNMNIVIRMAHKPDWKVFTLPTNYRCSQKICSAANNLIARNKLRIPKDTVALEDNSNGRMTARWHATELSEMNTILEQLADENLNECAVLLRTNWLVQHFSEALRLAGIPVAEKSQSHRPHDWQDCKDAVALAACPHNDFLATRVVKRTVGEGRAEQLRLQAMQNFVSLNEAVLHISPTLALPELPAMLRELRISEESVILIEQTCLDGCFRNVSELALALASEDLSRFEYGEGVTVTTIHSAKGREWKTVFLPAFNEEIIPSARTSDIEEERRLAYVAVTRAALNLHVSAAGMRSEQWRKEFREYLVSRFTKELFDTDTFKG